MFVGNGGAVGGGVRPTRLPLLTRPYHLHINASPSERSSDAERLTGLEEAERHDRPEHVVEIGPPVTLDCFVAQHFDDVLFYFLSEPSWTRHAPKGSRGRQGWV